MCENHKSPHDFPVLEGGLKRIFTLLRHTSTILRKIPAPSSPNHPNLSPSREEDYFLSVFPVPWLFLLPMCEFFHRTHRQTRSYWLYNKLYTIQWLSLLSLILFPSKHLCPIVVLTMNCINFDDKSVEKNVITWYPH